MAMSRCMLAMACPLCNYKYDLVWHHIALYLTRSNRGGKISRKKVFIEQSLLMQLSPVNLCGTFLHLVTGQCLWLTMMTLCIRSIQRSFFF